jgi:hypothetical protein
MKESHNINQVTILSILDYEIDSVMNIYYKAFKDSKDFDYIIVPQDIMQNLKLRDISNKTANLSTKAFIKFKNEFPDSKLKVIFTCLSPQSVEAYKKYTNVEDTKNDDKIIDNPLLILMKHDQHELSQKCFKDSYDQLTNVKKITYINKITLENCLTRSANFLKKYGTKKNQEKLVIKSNYDKDATESFEKTLKLYINDLKNNVIPFRVNVINEKNFSYLPLIKQQEKIKEQAKIDEVNIKYSDLKLKNIDFSQVNLTSEEYNFLNNFFQNKISSELIEKLNKYTIGNLQLAEKYSIYHYTESSGKKFHQFFYEDDYAIFFPEDALYGFLLSKGLEKLPYTTKESFLYRADSGDLLKCDKILTKSVVSTSKASATKKFICKEGRDINFYHYIIDNYKEFAKDISGLSHVENEGECLIPRGVALSIIYEYITNEYGMYLLTGETTSSV